jgi:hypothetical protein
MSKDLPLRVLKDVVTLFVFTTWRHDLTGIILPITFSFYIVQNKDVGLYPAANPSHERLLYRLYLHKMSFHVFRPLVPYLLYCTKLPLKYTSTNLAVCHPLTFYTLLSYMTPPSFLAFYAVCLSLRRHFKLKFSSPPISSLP